VAIAPQKTSAFEASYRVRHVGAAYARYPRNPTLARASHALAVGVSRNANKDPEILSAQTDASGAERDAGEPGGHRGHTVAMLIAFTMP
jgi:hypothetical protein